VRVNEPSLQLTTENGQLTTDKEQQWKRSAYSTPTLRDGEQSPGATLTLPEKLEIARHLEAMGVDIIEAGFPISSQGDFDSVACDRGGDQPEHRLRVGPQHDQRCRSRRRSREACGQAADSHLLRDFKKIHREHKLRKGKEEIIRISVESIKQAAQYTNDIEFSPEDASRTELEFLEEIVPRCHRGGRDDDQSPRHRRLCDSEIVRRDFLAPDSQAPGHPRKRNRALGPLP